MTPKLQQRPIPPFPIKEGVEYKHIPDHPYLAAGSDGTIISCKPGNGRGIISTRWRQLRPSLNGRGYPYVYVGRTINTKRQIRRTVHKLVLLAFVGPRPEGYECLHADGDKTNNRISNIRWGTPQENSDDKKRHGTVARGEKSGNSRLTELQVRAVKTLLAAGWRQQDVADLFGVTHVTIFHISMGRTWAWVTLDD